MITLARGPTGAQVPAEEPGGTGHPALRGLPAVWLRANCPCGTCRCVIIASTRIPHGRAGRAGS